MAVYIQWGVCPTVCVRVYMLNFKLKKKKRGHGKNTYQFAVYTENNVLADYERSRNMGVCVFFILFSPACHLEGKQRKRETGKQRKKKKVRAICM